MGTNLHANLTGQDIHSPYRQIFADEAARLGDTTVYTVDDLYKRSIQLDTHSEYYLSSYSPTVWSVVSGSGGGGSPTGPASGDLGGVYPAPTVVAIHTGVTKLTIGTLADTEYLYRSGATIASGPINILMIKNPVRAATVYHLPACTMQPDGVTLIADATGAFPTIDDVSVIVGDRILVKDEHVYSYADYLGGGGTVDPSMLGDPINNGIYVLTVQGDGATAWEMERSSDADTDAEVQAGTIVYVQEGTRYRDAGFRFTAIGTNPIELNTDPIYFDECTKPWHHKSLIATGIAPDLEYLPTLWDTIYVKPYASGATYTSIIHLLLPVAGAYTRGNQIKFKFDFSDFNDETYGPNDVITFTVDIVDASGTIDGDAIWTTTLVDGMTLVFESDGAGNFEQVG